MSKPGFLAWYVSAVYISPIVSGNWNRPSNAKDIQQEDPT